MAKESKKGVFTLNEIGAHALKKWPGRWKNQESAYASVKATAQRLEIGDINGKQKYKLIAAKDAARILEELTKHQKKTPQHGQADLFSLLPAEASAVVINPDKITPEIKKQIKDAFTGPAEVLTIDEEPKTTPPDLRALATAADILRDALRVFLDCLMEYERGRK